MEKIKFTPAEGEEEAWFYVLEQTRIGGVSYLLATDTEKEDGEAWILKDLSNDGDPEAIYEIVEDDSELDAVSRVFSEMLDDVEIER